MQPFRPPSAEVRTDFRRAPPTSDGYVCGNDATSLFNTSTHTAASSFVAPPGVPRRLDEPDVVILSEAPQQFRAKPHETTDEYYAYLWTIEGARYKKIYFGVYGLLLAIVLGVLLGYLVSFLTRGDYPQSVENLSDDAVIAIIQDVLATFTLKHTWTSWIQLPGDLLIRAMSCLVVPLIFVNVTVGIADICALHKSSVVGWRMVFFFLLTTMVAAGEGLFFAAFIPSSIFRTTDVSLKIPKQLDVPVAMSCPNGGGFLGVRNGSALMTCLPSAPRESLNLVDVNFTFARTKLLPNATTTPADVVFNLLDLLVTDNIMGAFAQENAIVSLVMFAMPLGIALGKFADVNNPILDLFRQLNSIFLIMIGWVINFVPVAIIFLVASSFVLPDDPAYDVGAWKHANITIDQVATWRAALPMAITRTNSFFSNFGVAFHAVGTLTAIFIAGLAFHALVFLPLLTFLTTRRNPYSYIFRLNKALNFGFGSASSLAALPMTIQAIDSTRSVSQQLTRFVIPIGTGVHLDGAAFYLSACTVFLLKAQTATDDPNFALSPSRVAMVFFTCVINAWSCAPIPHGGLLALNAVWQAVTPDLPTTINLPVGFVWVVAMDVLLDRFSTVVNILSNAVVTRIIAEQVDETYIDELDRGSGGTDAFLQ
ncbi:hypothetical protein SDRG_07404 [Saprolegnia diclina VS20]|uniref:Amino acid transporter n=1 Tax=Saprolegnia diclina (strain VS20) TaxID=1156394 RepID=T0RRQ2_SAPDV|nr:hypothetical protein SDRG_07404 [Saprolegnia diclina VS20]EQC35173.1 hypothetical protein SDRG_07404 [Saprolegnia diclina VS20]|eukprot:XP_008611457.1 hypothetical protein SDRG_07404 [Saprolegnia diclina VS20]